MSHAFTPTRRSARARRAALVLAAVVALGACSHNRPVPDDYGDTTRKNFIEGCEEALTETEGEGEARSDEQAAAICECSYEGISDPDDGIPFEDFKRYNEELEDEPGPLPDAILEKVDACKGEGRLS
jgi:hypothetical protein